MKHLQDKVAVITGAGRGIGRAHALRFAKEGARVVVNDAGCGADGSGQGSIADDVVKEIRATGGEAVADHRPVGPWDNARKLVQVAVDTYGKLDILVNNAGILRDRTLLKLTEPEWDDVIRVHLTGTVSCMQAAAQQMQEQGHGGRIINTSSSSGLLGNFGQANYGAAKAGVHALTRIGSLELAKYDITVNAIAPWAATRMLATMPGTEMDVIDDPLAPARVAPLVAFLASDAAKNVTGVTFGIEGNQIFTYRMLTSHGVTRFEQDAWTIEAIHETVQQIVDW